MILDKVFSGVLDQSDGGCLEIFDNGAPDITYTESLKTIKNMKDVVDSLYQKAGQLKL